MEAGRGISEKRNKVRKVTSELGVAKITILAVPDKLGMAAAIFEPLAQAGINVDTIIQNCSTGNRNRTTELTFTVTETDLERALLMVKPVVKKIGAKGLISGVNLGKVSIVGTGMQNTSGYASRMFQALAKQDINIQLITTSEIRITCIINAAQVKEAVQTLHQNFQLE